MLYKPTPPICSGGGVISKSISIFNHLQQVENGPFKLEYSNKQGSTTFANYMFSFFLNTDWGSIATINSREPMKGYPFSNVISFSDGDSAASSTGTPYFYVTDMDLSQIDINAKNQMCLSMTLAEGDYCSKTGYDPQDPPCPRLILTGSTEKIPKGSPEYAKAKLFLFSRHPRMATWPAWHFFYFTKMKLENIILLAQFGGATTVSVKDYYNATLIEKYEFISVFQKYIHQ